MEGRLPHSQPLTLSIIIMETNRYGRPFKRGQRLDQEIQEQIKSMHLKKTKQTSISRDLKVDRHTVARYSNDDDDDDEYHTSRPTNPSSNGQNGRTVTWPHSCELQIRKQKLNTVDCVSIIIMETNRYGRPFKRGQRLDQEIQDKIKSMTSLL